MTGTRPAEILRQLEQPGSPDGDLLARFVSSRDSAAFAELVRRHGPLVFGVCRRVTGHPQDAEDAFQATFLVLAKKAASLRNPALLGNWLYGVAYRVGWKAKCAAARRNAREVPVSALPEPHAPTQSLMSELTPILDEELAALPACYREAIVLCDLRGTSREAAAGALGIPEGTLSSRLANGRKKLATRLTKRGVSLSAAMLPAAVTSAQAGVTVANELLTKTCGLVADWAAGGAVPGSLARLAEGGLIVRKTLVLGTLMLVAVAGAVFAARPTDDAPPNDPPKPPVVAEQPPKQPVPKPGDVADYLTKDGKLRETLTISKRCDAPGQWETAWVIEPGGDWRVVDLKRDGTEDKVVRKGKLDRRQVAAVALHLAAVEFNALPDEFGGEFDIFIPMKHQMRFGKKVCTYTNPEHRNLRDGPSDFVEDRHAATWSRFALAVTAVEDLLRGDKPDR